MTFSTKRGPRFIDNYERMFHIVLKLAFKEATMEGLSCDLKISFQRVSQINIAGLRLLGVTEKSHPMDVSHAVFRYYHPEQRDADHIETFTRTLIKRNRGEEMSPGNQDKLNYGE